MPHKVNEPKSDKSSNLVYGMVHAVEPKSERWWEKEFDEKFPSVESWSLRSGDYTEAPIPHIKAFIAQVESRTRTDALKEAAGVAGTFKAPDFVEDLEDFKTYLEAAILSLIKEDGQSIMK